MSESNLMPKIVLHTLHNANGSATYIHNGTTIISGVNYPLEVPYRSDELPESTYIEVSVRPHNGVAMVREHYVEEQVKKVLSHVVRREETPRGMLQVTLQVVSTEIDEDLPGGVKGGGQCDVDGLLDVLVGCVNAAVAGCLDGGVMMRGYAGATLIGVDRARGLLQSPGVQEKKTCSSLHVLAFDDKFRNILIHSQGVFGLEAWQAVEELAKQTVCGGKQRAVNGGVEKEIEMTDSTISANSILDTFRSSVHTRVAINQRWQE